jgi:hypothetical protein
LGLLTAGLFACQAQDQQQQKNASPQAIAYDSGGFEGITSRVFAQLSTPCGTSNPVVITVSSGEFAYLYLRASDNMVVVNANTSGGDQCVFDPSNKISIVAAEANGTASHKVLLDFLNGQFAVGDASNIGIVIDLKTTGVNEVMFRGTTNPDIFTLATKSPTSYVAFATGSSPTPPTFASVSLANVSDVTISTGPGNDIIDGQATSLTSPSGLAALTGDISLTVFGGAGDDQITSGTAGTGQNSLNGGPGNDIFLQPATAFAHDVISGGNDSNATLTTTGTASATTTATTTAITTGTTTNGSTASATSVLTDTQTVTGTSNVPATATLTATYTQTKIGTQTLTGSQTLSATQTWSGTYLGTGTAVGTTKSFTATLTGTDTVTSTITVAVTATKSATVTASQTKTATGTAVGSGTQTETQTYAIAVTTSTVTSVQTDTSVDVVDYSHRSGAIKVTLGDESVAQAASATVIVPNSDAIHNYDGFTINDGVPATVTNTVTATTTDSTTSTATATVSSTTRMVEFHRTGSYTTGGITPSSGGAADLVNDDTFTVNDGNHSVTFHILLVATDATTGTTTNTNTKLNIQIPDTAVQSSVATAIATAIGHYQTATWTGTSTGTATLTSNSIVPNVTVSAPGTDNKVSIENRNDGAAAGSLLAASTTKLTTGTATSTSISTANPGSIVVNVSDTDPANVSDVDPSNQSPVHGDPAGTVATAVASAIPGSSGLTVTASASGAIVTITAGGTIAVRSAFAVTLKSGGFDLALVSTGTPVDGPGANDGDITNNERDSILSDVETIIGGSGDDTIDATHAGNTPHMLFGMSGNDTLICTGSTVSNALYGGPGNDHLIGGSGVDALYGGDGDDFVAGGPGNDVIDGDGLNCVVASTGVYASSLCTSGYAAASSTAGSNYLDYSDRTAPVTVNLATLGSATQIGVSGEKDTVTNCANLRGGSGNDILTGDSNANIIYGGPGDDTIKGGGGSDALYGNGGDDWIEGEAGNDFIYGGTGLNALYGDSSADTSVVGDNMLDDSDGRKGFVVCGSDGMDILFSNGEESGANSCPLQ